MSDVNCFGGSDGSIDLTVSGGSGSFTYLWSDGSTTEDLSGLSAGSYSVTVTDANFGCVETSSFTITAPSSSFAVDVQASGNGSACSGSGVTLSMLGWASLTMAISGMIRMVLFLELRLLLMLRQFLVHIV